MTRFSQFWSSHNYKPENPEDTTKVQTCWKWRQNQSLPPPHLHSRPHHQSMVVVEVLTFECDQLQQQDPLLPIYIKKIIHLNWIHDNIINYAIAHLKIPRAPNRTDPLTRQKIQNHKIREWLIYSAESHLIKGAICTSGNQHNHQANIAFLKFKMWMAFMVV